jgi:hypothetical protein
VISEEEKSSSAMMQKAYNYLLLPILSRAVPNEDLEIVPPVNTVQFGIRLQVSLHLVLPFVFCWKEVSETEAKFFSHRRETEGVCFASYASKRKSRSHLQNEKETVRRKAKKVKGNETKLAKIRETKPENQSETVVNRNRIILEVVL